MVCFRYVIVNTLHKGDNMDNNNYNNYYYIVMLSLIRMYMEVREVIWILLVTKDSYVK
jgi:hypothetical protein